MHTCGHPTSPMDVATTGLHHCASMLPMFDLLLSLGADPDAVDECGCDWLAAAAAAGYHGLWQALATEDRMAAISMRSVHASRMLLRAAQYSCNVPVTHGRPEFFEKAKDFLQRLCTAKRALAAFAQQLNEPATELVRDGVNELRPRPSHPLLAAMQGHLAPKVTFFTDHPSFSSVGSASHLKCNPRIMGATMKATYFTHLSGQSMRASMA